MSEMTPTDWRNLARQTKKWMVEIGARHNYKTNERGHIIRQDWVDRFEMDYSITIDDWTSCVHRMFELGYMIGFDYARGFFLCRPSDSATYLTRLINYAVSLMGTINKTIAAMEAGGKWKEIAPGLAGRTRIADVRDVTKALEDMGVTVTEEVKTALEDAQRLLTTARDKSH